MQQANTSSDISNTSSEFDNLLYHIQISTYIDLNRTRFFPDQKNWMLLPSKFPLNHYSYCYEALQTKSHGMNILN